MFKALQDWTPNQTEAHFLYVISECYLQVLPSVPFFQEPAQQELEEVTPVERGDLENNLNRYKRQLKELVQIP